MRALFLPAAFVLAALLWPQLPAAVPALLTGGLLRFYSLSSRLLGKCTASRAPVLACYLLVLLIVPSLLGAVHPAVAALLCVPLMMGFIVQREGAALKTSLARGDFRDNLPEYENRVRQYCAQAAAAFCRSVCLPLLLVGLGTPLHIGCGLGWALLGAEAVSEQSGIAKRIVAALLPVANAVFCFLLALCAPLVGRNPLLTQGRTAEERLPALLGLTDGPDSHAPVSGDVSQAVFLCVLVCSLACFLLTLMIFPLCR